MQAGEGRGAYKYCMRTDTKVAQVARAPVPRTTSRAVIRPSLTWEATARAGPRTQSDDSQDGVSYLQDPLEGATGPVIGRDGLHMPGLIFRAFAYVGAFQRCHGTSVLQGPLIVACTPARRGLALMRRRLRGGEHVKILFRLDITTRFRPRQPCDSLGVSAWPYVF